MIGGADGTSGWGDGEMDEGELMEEDLTSNVVTGQGTLTTDTGKLTVREDRAASNQKIDVVKTV